MYIGIFGSINLIIKLEFVYNLIYLILRFNPRYNKLFFLISDIKLQIRIGYGTAKSLDTYLIKKEMILIG